MLDRVSTRGESHIDVSPPETSSRISGWLTRTFVRVTDKARIGSSRHASSQARTPVEFARATLAELAISCELDERELDAVPRRGRLIFIANHPFGALDGLIAIALLGAVRPDLKVFANEDLCALRELAPSLLPIEVLGRRRSKRNADSLRRALRWLEGEGALLVFPAGEVSGFDVRARCVTDPPWSRAVALLARTARSRVIPMHFTGSNGLPFLVAGFIHPLLRTLMLPGELRRRAGTRVPVRIGAPLAFERLRRFDDEALVAHLRVTTYLLARSRVVAATVDAHDAARPAHPVAPPAAAAGCAAELARLPAAGTLLESGDHVVYCAPAEALPNVLDEIGRLREVALRAVGEGTGRARDLDAFDAHYEHLLLWNRRRGEILGACRVGRIDEIRKRHGRRGLHSATRFQYHEPFFTLLGPALELGRSFVRVEQQQSFTPQALLWKGIGAYLARHARYTRLLAPVGISNGYDELSRQLLVEFLRSHCPDPLLGALVRPAFVVERARLVQSLAAEVAMLGHLDALAALVEDIEPDRKGVPALLRQYLKLGGRMLAFNVDRTCNGAIDCLLMVDLRKTDPRVLRKYLPEAAVRRIAAPRKPPYAELRQAS